jgi:PAS domain S-box-containing protein
VATLRALVRARGKDRALRQSEARMRGIFERAGSAIALVDAAGFLAEVNSAFGRLLQLPGEALVGRLLTEFAAPGHRAQAEHAVAAWASGPWQGRFPLAVGATGRRLELSWNVSPHVEPGFSVAVATPALQLRLAGLS